MYAFEDLKMTSNEFCAGLPPHRMSPLNEEGYPKLSGGVDGCRGDGGGPLICNIKAAGEDRGKATVVGLIYRGNYPCATEGYAGVFSGLDNDWIEDNIG